MSLGDITFQIVGSANEAKKAVSELKGEVTGLDTSMKNLSVDKLANTLNCFCGTKYFGCCSFGIQFSIRFTDLADRFCQY